MFLQNLGYTALLLGVLVVVHEFGHFLLAKSLGVKVLRFSVGFGPRVFGFTRGETEYRLSLLPLGGYVKMAGDVPGEELPPEDAGRGFLAQPPWKRALIVAAGPVFNLVFPVLVYLAVFSLYAQPSTRVMSLEPGLPAANAGIQVGDRILSVDGHAVGSFEALRHRMQGLYDRPVAVEVDRDGQVLSKTLTPLPTSDEAPNGHATRGLLGVAPSSEPAVVGVAQGSPAAAAGLRSFDRIVSVDGQPVRDTLELRQRLKAAPAAAPVHLQVLRFSPLKLPGTNAQAPQVLSLTVPRQPGQEGLAALGAERPDVFVAAVTPDSPAAQAGIQPGDKLVALNGKPVPSFYLFQLELQRLADKPFQITWEHAGQLHTAPLSRKKMVLPDDPQHEPRWLVGIEPYAGNLTAEPSIDKAKVDFSTAVSVALWKVEDATKQAAGGFVLWVTNRLPFNSVGGPIMIYQLASKSAQAGAETFLNLMAVISISLGVMNLLPIPILDGFHLIAAFWEGIRRRPIPVRAREIANLVGLAMLIALMVVAFTNDLTR